MSMNAWNPFSFNRNQQSTPSQSTGQQGQQSSSWSDMAAWSDEQRAAQQEEMATIPVEEELEGAEWTPVPVTSGNDMGTIAYDADPALPETDYGQTEYAVSHDTFTEPETPVFTNISTMSAAPADVAEAPVISMPPVMHDLHEVSTHDEAVGLEPMVSETPAAETTPVNASPRLVLLRHTLEDVQRGISKALELISEEMGGTTMAAGELAHLTAVLQQSASGVVSPAAPLRSKPMQDEAAEGGRVVEGIFDGQNMIGADGKQYSVPPNYASKSKLVEGDIMKLTITSQGSFIYKQIRPVERQRIIAELDQNPETGEFFASLNGQRWRLLTASITYFKGAPGDEVVVMVPKESTSKWGAVENIIKRV